MEWLNALERHLKSMGFKDPIRVKKVFGKVKTKRGDALLVETSSPIGVFYIYQDGVVLTR